MNHPMPHRPGARPKEARPGSRQRGYTRKWEKARKEYLKKHPLCVYCKQQGRVVAATVVDHITPHKGDQALFWDVNNWQGLCKLHHDSVKQSEEKTGCIKGAGADGIPLDPGHHWHR